jgi:hypothetical protein
LLASGVFVALLPLGLAIARSLGLDRTRDVLALALPLAIGAMSIPLAIAALAGRFSVEWNGAWGWLLSVLTAMSFARARTTRFAAPPLNRISWNRVAVPVVLASAAIVYALGVVETPIGSRDEGVYTLAALALERAGIAEIGGPGAAARASGLFEPFVNGIVFHLPGIPAAAHLRPQFSPLLPAWIAQLHAIGGDDVLYRFNLLAAIACAGVFYALARRVVRAPCALVALLAFALNPAQVWIARINLAEPLGALFSLAGLLLVLESVRCGAKAVGGAAIALLALAVIVRVDMIMISPLLLTAATALAWTERDRTRSDALVRSGACALGMQAAAIAVLASWSPPYIVEHLRILLLAPAAAALAIVAYAVVRRRPAPSPLGRSRALAPAVLGMAITLLFLYAALVRPHVEPYALIPDHGSILAGTRDFREDSLPDLAAYIGWPCVILALVGVLVAIRRGARGRGAGALLVLSVVAVEAAVVYLWAPVVSPDHPWAIRRMATLVIPLSILLAGYGLQSLLHITFGWRQFRLAQLAVPVTALSLLALQRSTLRFSENSGLTAQVRAIEAALPDGPIVIRGYDGLATTLALGFGRDVLPLRDEFVAVNDASRALWAECGARACTLLHATYEGLDGLQLGAAQTLRLSREYIQPAFHPLATERRRETVNILASPVSGISANPPPSNAGAARDWRIDDHGFYRDELVPGAVARWTRGDATMTLGASVADRIEVRLASAAPAPMPLQIEIDELPRFEGTIAPGEHVWRFPVDLANAAPHRLRLRSFTFVPSRAGIDGDRRSLGVSVRAVRLLDGAAPVLSAASPASDFRSRLVIRRTDVVPADTTRGALAFRVDVDNVGAAAWPSSAEVGQRVPSVALGYYWLRTGDGHRLVEQRIALPYSLSPGEHWSTAMIVDLDSQPPRRLPPGEYELHVGLVLDGVAWFSDRGDAGVTIPMTIAVR